MHQFVTRPRVARQLSGYLSRASVKASVLPGRRQSRVPEEKRRCYASRVPSGVTEEPLPAETNVDLQKRAVELGSLYDPGNEKDACGVGFVANIKCKPSHLLVRDALEMLERMEHRGACGCDPDSGDGAGILV
eukprot:1036570-Amorphochlora_amoeboformis.AAC.2